MEAIFWQADLSSSRHVLLLPQPQVEEGKLGNKEEGQDMAVEDQEVGVTNGGVREKKGGFVRFDGDESQF